MADAGVVFLPVRKTPDRRCRTVLLVGVEVEVTMLQQLNQWGNLRIVVPGGRRGGTDPGGKGTILVHMESMDGISPRGQTLYTPEGDLIGWEDDL